MTRESIISKIKNLMKLAEEGSGASDNEVQIAMLKARELMAKYNISLSETQDVSDHTLQEFDTGILYNQRYSVWKLPLANVISKYHMCSSISLRFEHKQSREIRFVGEGENPKIVGTIFKSIVPYLESKIYAIHDKYSHYNSKDRYVMSDSYVKGFIDGLKKHYDSQNKSDPGMAIMVTTPQSVSDYIKTLTKIPVQTGGKPIDKSQYNKGYEDGFMHLKDKLEEVC